ncbi:hypothetical protein P4O66_016130, partial [Electrophorus voltai]
MNSAPAESPIKTEPINIPNRNWHGILQRALCSEVCGGQTTTCFMKSECWFAFAAMPVRAVTSRFMYRGLCSIPDILSYRTPVSLPEDEVEGQRMQHREIDDNAAHGASAEIREAFKVFDRDGNGFISKQELGMAMRSLGYMPNEVELEVIIKRLDMDGDGQVGFEEFVTLLGPKLTTTGMPDKFHGADFDSIFWKCDMQKLTVDELKRLLYDTFCDHLTMKDIENIIMTEESHVNSSECQVDI